MSLEIVRKNEEHPFRNSLLALTLEAEIKRCATEREEPVGAIINKLARFTGASERQIYNYRVGKTQIPENKILIFCKQFLSSALATAWLADDAAMEEPDGFDLVKLANRSCRQVLDTHSAFLAAFDDGQIDGFELTDLKTRTAATFAEFSRLQAIAEADYQRRRAA